MTNISGAVLALILTTILSTVSPSAQAVVHKVFEGESIQAAIDAASPGDTIVVEPGDYMETDNGRYGLRITTDNLRLIGKTSGKTKKMVRLLKSEDQETGILAAPALCEYDFNESECQSARGEAEITYVKSFYIRGFSVEGFPKNGIQTRWVDGFQFVGNHSVNNLNNGIYPTLSANGLVRSNVSYGSLDTAMWIAGSENVRVFENELFGSVIGFEITVSNNVEVFANNIYDNSVGVGLFHPDGAGNPPLPEMKNWVIKNNNIHGNNRPNNAPEGSFQRDLPSGGGVLLLGVSDHEVFNNTVTDNGYVGIAVFGWCTSLLGTGRDCTAPETDPLRPRDASNNVIRRNRVVNNGTAVEIPPEVSPVDFTQDIAYFHFADIEPSFSALEAAGTGNCFERNIGKIKGEAKRKQTEVTIFSSYKLLLGMNELPTDGC